MNTGRFIQRGGQTLACAVAMLAALTAVAETVDFRGGWRFTKGDPAGAEATSFDDSSWSAVRLPHDWAIAGPFNESERSGFAAKLPWKGVGWYRKSFKLDQKEGERVYLDFDGVMAFPKVYVNGKLAGDWDYGYTSFRIDATPFVNLHGDNEVAVRVDTTNHGTRWYPGAGIYRKVTMELRRPVHIAQWGVFITTPEITDEKATVAVEATVENHADAPANANVDFVLLNPAGGEVAKRTFELASLAGNKQVAHSFTVEKPQRWDVIDPKLYTLRTVVRVGNEVVDSSDQHFGIRKIELTANDGLHLNGRRVQLQGVCLHHDQGPLGGAFYTRAMERQLQIMQDMGVNALRTSHNAPAPEVLDLCDRMGILVWDECFDKWDDKADRVRDKPSHQEHADRHLRSLVMRDRNHPSVMVWSIGNEIGEGGQGVTADRVKMMRDVVLKFDSTRPVGMACHIPEQSRHKVLDALDFMGWNYGRRYALYRENYPDKPIMYSESASALSTRGFYELPLPTTKTDYAELAHQVDSYDLNAAPWSDIADVEYKLMEDDSFVAGDFVWTGIDYLGEPTPFDREANSSYFGIVDLCGIPKDRFYLQRSHWKKDAPTVHIVPHWNWPDRVGKNVPVFVYTNGDSAELFLNGKSLGKRSKGAPPAPPTNLAAGRTLTASSSENDKQPALAIDGDANTRWCAADEKPEQWYQVDLGELKPLKSIVLEFEKEAKNYGYEIKVSDDAKSWQAVVKQSTSREPQYGAPRNVLQRVDATGRYVRIEFNRIAANGWASIREFGVYSTDDVELPYYAPTYKYRLRWNDVTYEPGELKAVAYKDGKEVGQEIVRTAGAPAAIRLTPDRAKVEATGDDLCFVLVEAIDKDGILCPLADSMVHFKLEGPGDIAGVGNGNPMSYEPFQADYRKLFNGKAMLIVRTREASPGTIRITAGSDGLKAGEAKSESAER